MIVIGLLTDAVRGLYWSVLERCDVPPRVTGFAIGIVSLLGYSPDVFLPLLIGWLTTRVSRHARLSALFRLCRVRQCCGRRRVPVAEGHAQRRIGPMKIVAVETRIAAER
ncbi:hypothetical protein [Burkholderia pyrrocinia]|uniref:hypothetical protein n=1 Tax=Burkholderia pyrrocinia TaxID=60550 RepID=UPI002AB1F88F|nr:hypothetical protein [Burkholderia pyrrocinia]